MNILFAIKFWLKTIGFNTHSLVCFIRGIYPFIKDYRLLKKDMASRPDFKCIKIHPLLEDKFKTGGTASGHYFHQDLLVAKRIFKQNPRRHLDIGSRVDGFVAHVAVFREIEVIDIRPLPNKIENIHFMQADLLQIPESLHNQFDSVSCLHAIEHIGLGRYGDPINSTGHLQAIEQLYKLLEPGGTLYLSAPIGNHRIEFNAHRVFGIDYLLTMFRDKFFVKSFSFVDDAGDLKENIELTPQNSGNNCGCNFGCGIFELGKINLRD